MGDLRLCLLSCFGGRVHRPLALAIVGRMKREGLHEVEVVVSDEGIILRLPDREQVPALLDLLPSSGELEKTGARGVVGFDPLRRAFPRSRGAKPAPAAAPARFAFAAVGAATEGARSPFRGLPLPVVPADPRGLSRVPHRGLRCVRHGRAPAPGRKARGEGADPRRGSAVAIRDRPSLRLRRHRHVRRRCAPGRTSRPRPVDR